MHISEAQTIINRKIEQSLNVKIIKITQVNGGWLNSKWKLSTSEGEYLVKQYSPKRYIGTKLDKIEKSLEYQHYLNQKALQCPKIYNIGGSFIQRIGEDINYVVMDFVYGNHVTPETVNMEQMFHLGYQAGLMHKLMSEFFYEDINTDELLKQYQNEYSERLHTAQVSGNKQYLSYIEKQGQILNSIDNNFLSSLPKGIAHGDFAIDNILFKNNYVSAILDFDTIGNWRPLPYRDIGRAILSFCLHGNVINNSLISAFIKGYNEHLYISDEDIVKSIQFVWLNEINWWSNEELFERKELTKTKRFFNEMYWVTDNWFNMSNLIRVF